MSNLHIFNLILLLQLLLVVHAQDGESAYDFQAFYKQFNRQYQGDEKAKRKAVFERNYQQLLDARARSQGQFEVRVNNFTDMTQEEINNFFSYKPSQLNMPFDPLPSKNMLRAIALPQAFNYTAQGKVTPVKNQKKCGSCWAFATTAMYESQLLIKAIGEYDLSEQYVLQCTPQSSCNGGWPNTALHMFSDKGIPTQASNPYLADASPQNICSTQQLIKLPYQVEQIKHYNEVPDNELKQILLDNGPISVGVKGNGNGFLFYGGGVFTGCNQITESNQIDHVLLLVGWTKEGDWIVKNSWGKGWGDRGYAVISGKKNCGINKFVDVMKVGKTLIGQQNTNIDAIGTNEMQNLKVKLSDSFGDGWNGYVMGVRQDNSIITVFGEQFKSGSQQGPIDIQIKSGVQTQIVVAVAGKNSHQIGFSITDSEGKQVCSRNSGTPFVQTIIFCSFCPSCVTSDTVNFYYTLTGNGGWKGNVLAFKQNGMQTSFGEQFVGGDRYGPRKIQFIRNAQVEVLPYLIGSNTQQIGFQVRDSFGNLVLQRTPGTAFIKDSKLGNFCPGCENIFGINYDSTEYEDRSPYQIARHVDEKSLAPFIASIAVLSTMVIILGGVVVILALKNRKMTMSIKGSGQNLQKKQYIRQQSVPSENLSKSEVQKPETQASILPSQMDEINPVGSKAYIVSGTSTKYIN